MPELYHEIAKMRFIPVTERVIEEPHSRIKRSISYRNHGPLTVSMTARGREVEHAISDAGNDPTCAQHFSALASHIASAASVRRIPHLLEVGLHPWLRKYSEQDRDQTSKWVTLLSCTLYRCDDLSQFDNFQEWPRWKE